MKSISELSRCAWDALKAFFQTMIPEENAVPGAVIAIQTLGDFLGYNPLCRGLCTDGAFYGSTMFRVAPRFILKDLEKLFQCKVFKMLLSRKKITEDFIEMATWPPKVQGTSYHLTMSARSLLFRQRSLGLRRF